MPIKGVDYYLPTFYTFIENPFLNVWISRLCSFSVNFFKWLQISKKVSIY